MVAASPEGYAWNMVYNLCLNDHFNTICIPCSWHTLPERLRRFKHQFYSIPFWTARKHLNTIRISYLLDSPKPFKYHFLDIVSFVPLGDMANINRWVTLLTKPMQQRCVQLHCGVRSRFEVPPRVFKYPHPSNFMTLKTQMHLHMSPTCFAGPRGSEIWFRDLGQIEN